jgi:hypothetical protein
MLIGESESLYNCKMHDSSSLSYKFYFLNRLLGKIRKAYQEEVCQRLKSGRIYVLDPNKKYAPRPAANPA